MTRDRLMVAAIAVVYLVAVVVAVLTYRPGDLLYGAASWIGGVTFVLGVQSYRKARP